ncbi:MAG: GntR family transcriptional regulator [Bacillota bacterium]|jgi:GntR family transcriptional regulator
MKLDFESEKPLYLQIAEEIEDAVFTGAFAEETQIPSTTEISVAFKINPATVLKGMNMLVDEGIIYKKRGVGMFVSAGALAKIKQKRQHQFFDCYVQKLVNEAHKLGFSKQELNKLIERGYENEYD